MSLTATPVSMTDILNLQAGIEGFTNAAEATAEVALINAGTDTVQGYATKLRPPTPPLAKPLWRPFP